MILRNRAYHLAAMPPIFMKFLKNYQRKLAVRKIITFLKEYSTLHSHLIIKKFMSCVRQAQVFIRGMIRIKKARVLLITLYWEKVEKNYRKQIEDQEREAFARQQRERMARINTGASSDVHGRWGMTHKQVISLFSHMDTVEIHRANILRETGSSSRSSRLRNPSTLVSATTTVLSDTVDPVYRQGIIEKYLSYKRSLHLKKGTKSPHLSRAASPAHAEVEEFAQPFADDAFNIKLIKKFIHGSVGTESLSKIGVDETGVKTSRELLERQLAAAGVAIDTDHDLGRKRRAAKRVFRRRPLLCLTDPTLGKPWKQIIEEVVREDIIRKKRQLQEQNRKIFQDRVAEEKKRGIPIPTFTSSSAGRRGTEAASSTLNGMTATVSLSAFSGKRERPEDDAISSSSSPRTQPMHHNRRGTNQSHSLSMSASSPAMTLDQSHNKAFTGDSPRLPLL